MGVTDRDENAGVYKAASKRWTVCVDFDGVIHQYVTKWVNPQTIPDPPVDGAIEWLFGMIQDFDVAIFSTRCETWRGRMAIRAWLREWSGNIWHEQMGACGIEDVRLTKSKPPALVYLDDRAIRFEGAFPTKEQIHDAVPWNRKKEKA